MSEKQEARKIVNIERGDQAAKDCAVRHLYGSLFEVTSATSGEEYIVNTDAQTCNCKWGQYRPIGTPSGCKHARAVAHWLAAQNGDAIAFHLADADTSKQKRREDLSLAEDGLKAVIRKSGKPAPSKNGANGAGDLAEGDLAGLSLDQLNNLLFG